MEQAMNYEDQRQLAIDLFSHLDPKLEWVITYKNNCFYEITGHLSVHRKEVLEIIKDIEIPSEWAYKWAIWIGDHDVMIDKVTESKWAYFWARHIGDHGIMNERVTDIEWRRWWDKTLTNKELRK
jgi:hypothetical protein